MNSPSPAIARPVKARLTVEDFLLLDEHGVFAANTRTELIEGEIWYVNALHTRHGRMTTELATDLNIALRSMTTRLRPAIAVSTRVNDHSLPEPDIVVSTYEGLGVMPLDAVALIIEISDSTLDIDLGRKLHIYARANIAEYWVVDLQADRILQMWSPEGDVYRECREVALGDPVVAMTIVGLTVPTVA